MAVPSDVPKDLKKHLKRAEKQGWSFKPTKSGYQLLAPDGVSIVTIHKTPAPSAIPNIVADMRRFGYKE